MPQKNNFNFNTIGDELVGVVERLCQPESYREVVHRANHDMPMPSIEELDHFVSILRTVLFPGYFGHLELTPNTLRYYIGSRCDRIGINVYANN